MDLSNAHTKSIPAKEDRIIASLSSWLGQLLWLGLMEPLQQQFTGKSLTQKIMSRVKNYNTKYITHISSFPSGPFFLFSHHKATPTAKS